MTCSCQMPKVNAMHTITHDLHDETEDGLGFADPLEDEETWTDWAADRWENVQDAAGALWNTAQSPVGGVVATAALGPVGAIPGAVAVAEQAPEVIDEAYETVTKGAKLAVLGALGVGLAYLWVKR